MTDGRIVVSGLTKQYQGVTAVNDLSFTVEPGRVTGFLGPNGAGKTTTLRMLLNLVMPTAGTATIGGHRYADLDEPTRVVGAVLEASSAHKGRTGRNHLRACCLTVGLPLSRADEVLDLVGLTPAADRKFKGYSLGMRQRLGIAAAMLGDPGVLILDEPANGLDPEGIRWMRELLQGLAAQAVRSWSPAICCRRCRPSPTTWPSWPPAGSSAKAPSPTSSRPCPAATG
jgi:ABC-2 type transport system ATP-binding protein